MKKLLFLSILLQLIVSCTSNEYKKLEEVYACLRKGQNKSALLALSAIEKDKLSDSSSIAYYYLLKAQAYYKTSNTHNVDTLLDRCIRYYEKEKEYELLARSYYYKACVLKDREMFSDAISNAKKCEKLVLIHCIDDLMHQIYDLLAGLNFQTGNFNQSLSYNRRALAISSEAGDEKLILADKIKLSTTFRELNMRDSSEYYTLKANDIAKVGNEVMKANALDNLSVYYLNRNRLDSAEYFIRRSLHISPSASSNIIYGDIKRRQGKLEEANGLWGKVSKEDALDLRIKALACMSDYKKEKGLYKDAVLLQDSMIALKNSLKAKQHSEENIQTLIPQHNYNIIFLNT